MSSVILNGDTSGAVTLTVPSVAGTNTVTIPAAAGTVMVSGNMPAFAANMSATQSIANNTATKLIFNVKTSSGNATAFDTNGYYDATTNYRFTPLIAGYYQINGTINTAFTSATGLSYLSIYKNGTEYAQIGRLPNSTVASLVLAGSSVIYFNGTTDYVELYAFQNTGTSQSFGGGTFPTGIFSGSMVRAA
jgi:hypothetical protein